MSCESCELCIEQPPFWEAVSDGVFIKQMLLKEPGTMVPQHAHVYDHTSMLATGAVRMWQEEKLIGDFRAPYPIFIKAKIRHTFQSLEPNTLLYCIHRLHAGYQSVPIHAEHQFS